MESSRALLLVAVAAAAIGLADATFRSDCNITWEPQNAHFADYGDGLSMALVSNTSGCALRTYKQFIYGSVSTMIQLVPGNSAGTVTTYYTSSVGDNHDEIDFEFLGNATGEPYTIHTNIFADGIGRKEMQFRPWFDPTDGYHNYTISWTPCMVVWYVDSVPIRVFRNYQRDHGVPFPTSRPMYGYSSIWNADDWATQGGRVKADWTHAPFVANYQNINLAVCECYGGDCVYACAGAFGAGQPCNGLGDYGVIGTMKWVQDNYRVYDYCTDPKRAAEPVPVECNLQQH